MILILFFLVEIIFWSLLPENCHASDHSLKSISVSSLGRSRSDVVFARTSLSACLKNKTALLLLLVQPNYLVSKLPVAALFVGRFKAMHFQTRLWQKLSFSIPSKWMTTLSNFPVANFLCIAGKVESRQLLATSNHLDTTHRTPRRWFF